MKRKEHWLIPIIAKKPNGGYRHNDWASHLLRFILFSLSLVYRLLAAVRNWCYDKGWLRVTKVDAPIISVGNLTVGGTGKTPLVLWLIEQLNDEHNIAVVSRGYRKLNASLNDEGMEISRRFPRAIQIQDKDRVAAAKQALSIARQISKSKPLIILDDGFQHRRLHRNINLVVIDATLPFGYEHLLPRGLLREPIQSLYRADAVVLTRSDLAPPKTIDAIRNRVFNSNRKIVWAEAELACDHWISTCGLSVPLEQLRSKSVLAFCGIGNPDGFHQTLQKESINVSSLFSFPDHHHFTSENIAELIASAKGANCEAIVCTCKDLVKLPQDREYEIPIYALATNIRIVTGASELQNLVRGLGKKAW